MEDKHRGYDEISTKHSRTTTLNSLMKCIIYHYLFCIQPLIFSQNKQEDSHKPTTAISLYLRGNVGLNLTVEHHSAPSPTVKPIFKDFGAVRQT